MAALRELLVLVGVGTVLGVVSRVWLARWIVGGLLVPAGRYVQSAYQILRTPGNITHELGHAVGFLLTGYRVLEIRFWFNDPARRGYVKAGRPFAPWARPLIARLIASPAPLLSGALALQACALWLQVPPALTAAFTPGPSLLPTSARLELGWQATLTWLTTPGGPAQAVGFALLALSLGIDLAPSWEDVRSLMWPLTAFAGLLLGIDLAAQRWPALRPVVEGIDPWIAAGFHWIAGPLWWALIALIGLSLLLLPVRLLVAGWRP